MKRLTPPNSGAGEQALAELQSDVNALYDRFALQGEHDDYTRLGNSTEGDGLGVQDGRFSHFVHARRPDTISSANVEYFLRDFAAGTVGWRQMFGPQPDGPVGYTKL